MNQIIDLEPFPETRPLTELDRNRERMMQSENKFTRMLAECETIAEIIQGLEGMLIDRDARLEKMAKVQLPPDLRAEFLALMEETDAHFRRHLEPWPDWVVRLAADLWSVQAPTIPKAKILETLRFIHFLVFEFRFYCPASRASFRWPDIDAKIMGAVIGHSVARMEKDKREFSEFLEKSRLSKEKHAEFTAHLSEFSIDGYMAELAPHLAECAKEYPAHVIPFMEGLAIAKANTIDTQRYIRRLPRFATVIGTIAFSSSCTKLKQFGYRPPDSRPRSFRSTFNTVGVNAVEAGAGTLQIWYPSASQFSA